MKESQNIIINFNYRETRKSCYYPILLHMADALISERCYNARGSLQFYINLLDESPREELLSLIKEEISRQDEEKSRRNHFSNSTDWEEISVDEWGDELHGYIRRNPRLEKLFFSFMKEFISQKRPAQNPFEIIRSEELPNVKIFYDVFSLTEEEILTLLTLYLLELNDELNNLLDNPRSEQEWVSLLQRLWNIPLTSAFKIFNANSPLFSSGLLTQGRSNRHSFDLTPSVVHLFSGLSLDDFLSEHLKRGDSDSFPLESYPVTNRDREFLKRFMNAEDPAALLLHGKPGTGKTSFAQDLCREAGYEPLFLSFQDSSGRDNRLCSLQLAAASINRKKHALLIDEADKILNTNNSFALFFGGNSSSGRSEEKGKINDLLDTLPCKTIWITNRTTGIDSSVLRRFSYQVNFPELSLAQRRQIWQNQLSRIENTALIPESAVLEKLIQEYEVPASVIRSAVQKGIQFSSSPAESETLIRQLMANHTEILPQDCRIKPHKETPYNISILNTSCPAEKIIAAVESWKTHVEHHPGEQKPLLSFLFHGDPGTGKTALARHVSEAANIPLLVKNYADLSSAYVGESEKRIRDAFLEAEKKESLLLIDEADSLLYPRSRAQRSWEVSCTNQFLTSLETFQGILFCTTNRIKDLDPAALRRFYQKVEFRPLESSQYMSLFETYFPAAIGSADDREKTGRALRKIPHLTAGDFAAVFNSLRFEAEPPSCGDLLARLQEESSHRRDERVIGF